MTLTELGSFLRRRRGEMGLTQGDVAEGIDKPINWVSRLETGALREYPDPDTLKKLATLLRTSEEVLLQILGYLDEDEGRSDESVPSFWAAYSDRLTDDDWEVLERMAQQLVKARGIKP